MFTNEHMSVGDWLLFSILSAIPVINILVWLVVLLSSNSNKSLKSLLLLNFLVIVVGIAIFIALIYSQGYSLQDYLNSIGLYL